MQLKMAHEREFGAVMIGLWVWWDEARNEAGNRRMRLETSLPLIWHHALAYNRLFDPLLRWLVAGQILVIMKQNVCPGGFIRVSFATFTFTFCMRMLALAATEQKGQQQENMK